MTLVAHENSISQFRRILSNEEQTQAITERTVVHLLDIENKLGVALLVAGFVFLGLGILANAASFFFPLV